MKKHALILSLVLGLSLIPAVSYGADADAGKAITEIGILVNAQKYQIAMTKCNTAIQKYPNESFLYYWRGSIHNSMGEKQLAIEDFNKAIALDPKEGALEDYNKAIELAPEDGSAYSMRAMVKLDLGDMDGANSDLDTSNKLMNSK